MTGAWKGCMSNRERKSSFDMNDGQHGMGREWERSRSIQKTACRTGFDWPDVTGVLDKIIEEVEELQIELQEGQRESIAEEFGDLLFSVIKLSRFIPHTPSECLAMTNDKFSARFSYIREKAAREGAVFSQLSLNEMNRLWDEAKKAIQ